MNTTIKTGLAILMLAISCKKESNPIRSSTVAQSTEKALRFTIGQRYGGGIIFYIDSTGQHGLIADTADLKTSKWGNGLPRTLTEAKGTKIGSGYSNTKKIILAQGDSGTYAARRCWHDQGSGYRDWFLPSKDELNELFKQQSVVGIDINGRYWSSSEINIYRVWCQTANGQGYNLKRTKNNVRAIRTF